MSEIKTQPINISQQVVPQKSIGQLFAEKKSAIQQALPKHLTPERMLRIAMTELNKSKNLQECTPVSLIGAVIQCAQLGLEPGQILGHCYLIPYHNKRENITECQFMIGYRGMIELVMRSGKALSLNANAVYEGDIFEFEYGINEKLRHIPGKKEKKVEDLIAVYAIVKLQNGGNQMQIMWRPEIDRIKARSKTSNNGPWVTDYEEMAKKTVIRRLFKYCPVSIEIQQAIGLDEQAERGEQHNSFVIDGELTEQSLGLEQTKADTIASKI